MHAATGQVLAKLTADGVLKLRLAVSGTISERIAIKARKDSQRIKAPHTPRFLDGQSKLQDLLKEHKPLKTGHGACIRGRRFTRYAAQWVRESAAVIERTCGTNVVFCTATLPRSTPQAMKVLAAHSSYLTELLNQWIRDNVQHALMVGVWEYQKRGALHLHWAVGTTERGALDVVKDNLKEWWCKVLTRLSRETCIDMFERKHGGTWRNRWDRVQVDVSYVRESITRYLSKYLTKSQRAVNNTWTFPPASWWSCSRTVRSLVAAARRETGSVQCELLTARAAYARIEGVIKHVSASQFTFENKWRPGEVNVWAQFTYECAIDVWDWLTDWIQRHLDHFDPCASKTYNELYVESITKAYWKDRESYV